MKKQVTKIALALAFLSAHAGFSQENRIQPCNTYAAMEAYFAATPGAKANYEKVQAKMQEEYLEFINNKAANKSTSSVQYTIPVVFHILHVGGAENITDAQCIAALAQVNRDYAREGSDTASIFHPFKSLYINSDMKFMLAKKDPNGNCTSGIEHIYDTRTDWDQSDISYYTGLTWNPAKYLNVIIVKKIIPSGPVTGGGIIVGYTHLPGTAPFQASNTDAIVYNCGYLGGLDARSLSHEIGHWFNLIHTFGNTNNPGVVCGSTSGGDQVSDTPDTKGNFSTCPASSTNSNIVCASNQTPYYQNVENFMDYSSCPKNFTTGQTLRMQAALNSAVGGRSNVWSAGNLAATDVNGLVPCAPIANFLSTNGSYTVCSGSSLSMKDFSYNGTITSYQWGVDIGGIIASPTSSLTNITFTTVGTSIVTLTVSNTQGSSTANQTVTVIDATPGITGPQMESFESPGTPVNWTIINPDGDPVTWAQTSTSAYDQSSSFFIDGPNNPPNAIDILQMPIMDVLHNQSNIFEFAYAYRQQSSSQNDQLKIQGSKDCGGTWQDIYVMSAGIMAAGSGAVSPDPFYPVQNEWKVYQISSHPTWNSFKNSASVSIRFTFVEGTAGHGNNMYIDAVNFYSLTGVNELTKSILFNMYPNPTTGETNVNFNLNDPASVKINVLDVLGREVLPVNENNFGPGEHTITVNKENTLPKGIYFVNLSLNGAKMSSKLIIN